MKTANETDLKYFQALQKGESLNENYYKKYIWKFLSQLNLQIRQVFNVFPALHGTDVLRMKIIIKNIQENFCIKEISRWGRFLIFSDLLNWTAFQKVVSLDLCFRYTTTWSYKQVTDPGKKFNIEYSFSSTKTSYCSDNDINSGISPYQSNKI